MVGSVCGCSPERPQRPSGSDAVTDLAGGYYYSALPWQWAATRACIRYSSAGGDYSTSVVKGGSGAYATVGYGR